MTIDQATTPGLLLSALGDYLGGLLLHLDMGPSFLGEIPGLVVEWTIVIVLASFAADALQAWIDPRVRT